jgi:hypothetical protein
MVKFEQKLGVAVQRPQQLKIHSLEVIASGNLEVE